MPKDQWNWLRVFGNLSLKYGKCSMEMPGISGCICIFYKLAPEIPDTAKID